MTHDYGIFSAEALLSDYWQTLTLCYEFLTVYAMHYSNIKDQKSTEQDDLQL